MSARHSFFIINLLLLFLFLVPHSVTADYTPKIAPIEELNSTSSIALYIAKEALRHDYSPIKALSIARAESGLQPNIKNPRSTASGIYQFLDSTFQSYCIDLYSLTSSLNDKNNIKIQVECALLILTTDSKGEYHWDASRKYWATVGG